MISSWLLLLALSLPFGRLVSSELSSGFGETNSESQLGVEILDQDLGFAKSSITLVFNSPALVYSDPVFRNEVERVLSSLMRSEPTITRSITPYNSGDPFMVSEDEQTIYTIVYMDVSVDDAMNMVSRLREGITSDVLGLWTTGGIPIFYDMNIVSEHDLRRAESVAFPIILIVLILVFGSVVAAGLPVIIGVVSIVITSSLVYLLAQVTDISIFVLNIATLLGLGVAVDYSLLVVSRFREEFADLAVDEALGRTMATAGKSVMFSAVTSILGLSGLLLFDFMMLRSLGIGGVTVMLLSLCVAMTLLPAIIAVLGNRVNSLRLLKIPVGIHGFWSGLANWVMRHPIRVIVPLTTLLILLAVPFLGVKLGAPWASILPAEVESREGFDILNREIGPGETSPILVVYKSPTRILAEPNLTVMYDLVQQLNNHSSVIRTESIFSIAPNLSLRGYQELFSGGLYSADLEMARAVGQISSDEATFIKVVPSEEIMHDDTKELVESIRSMPVGGDLKMYVTGGTADLMDSIDVIYGSFPIAIIYVLVTIYIALFSLFRSVVLPLKAVIMNGLSIFATYGALVFIFQEGNLQGILGFESMGYTDAIMPIVLFCITFGISMDYEVFLLSRVKELYDENGNNTASVALGLERTGRIITSAALVMILVCGSFALADIVIVKMFGVGLGLAILIDATLVRALMVPAIMRVMGDLNWWCPNLNPRKLWAKLS